MFFLKSTMIWRYIINRHLVHLLCIRSYCMRAKLISHVFWIFLCYLFGIAGGGLSLFWTETLQMRFFGAAKKYRCR